MESIRINIAGDLFLGKRIERIAQDNPTTLFDEKILDIFTNADFNIINLESPLTLAGNEHKILKTGPHMKSIPTSINVLKILNIQLATLANNHIYDFGDKGLLDTIELCKSQNISTVGAGMNLIKASEISLHKIGQITIGIVNITENEWSIASDTHGGANPVNIIANVRSIINAKKEADIVILIIHGGNENFNYPSPRIIDQYRFYAEQGASLIVGHHAHCISGYETYNEVPIFYGLGNFLFDYESKFSGWYEGLVLNIMINSKKEITWKLLPYQQCKGKLRVELLDENERIKIEKELLAINNVILNPQQLKEKYNELIIAQEKEILSMLSTSFMFNNKYVRSIIRKLGLERFFIRHDQLKLILNSARCESLKDVMFGVIENYLKTNKKYFSKT